MSFFEFLLILVKVTHLGHISIFIVLLLNRNRRTFDRSKTVTPLLLKVLFPKLVLAIVTKKKYKLTRSV